MNQEIFKAYDIRGIYPTDLNEEVAYLIGRAFARRAGVKTVTVGCDMRLSSPALKAEIIRGITDEGCYVSDIGLVSIDAVYVAVGKLGHEAGIMITASHNPKEYNGCKMVIRKPEGLEWIRGKDLKKDIDALPPLEGKPKGRVTEEDVLPRFIDHVLSFADISKIKPLTVVIDAGNGMAGKIIPLLEPYLPVTILPLNFQLDGNFPAHPSNPLMPESRVQITKAVVEHRADLGVIFDGDTDRVFFVDEKGNFIRADYTLLILAKEFLRREPGAGIVYNVICSKAVPEKIHEWGGRPIRSEVGFVNIGTHARKENGVMGGELSAHYSFRDNMYADSGFIALLLVLQLLSESGESLSKIVQPFQVYAKSDEVNLPITDREGAIQKIKTAFADGKQDEMDGITVEYDDWWFNARPSNTEPLLRITVEAKNSALLAEKLEQIKGVIESPQP